MSQVQDMLDRLTVKVNIMPMKALATCCHEITVDLALWSAVKLPPG